MISTFLLAVSFAGSLPLSGSPAATEWKAGVASVAITPETPTWLSGYSSRTRPAEGKVHDLYAKALALESQDGTRLVLVTLDLGSVGEEITRAVHERVARKHGLPRAALILNVSHTHCAPEVAAERRVFYALPDAAEHVLVQYIQWLELEPLPALEKLRADARSGSPLAQRKAQYLLDRLQSDGEIELNQPCPVHVARFGEDLLLVAIGGETVVDYSLRIKREYSGPFVWVAGYCDDVFAYFPSQRVLREGGYEGRDGILHQLTPTPFAESVEDRVMAAVRRIVQETKRP